MTFRAWIGLWRSRLMYYWKPFNQRRLRKFYGQFISEGDLCFDIGSHLGNRSKVWISLGATVVALEPQPLCVDFLKRKLGTSPRFRLIEKAVGATPGILPMHISENAPTVSSLADEQWRKALNERSNIKVTWGKVIEVEVTTLDQLIKEFGLPKFCKIDVEDFEVEVLKGLSTPIPIISFEFFNWTPERTQTCLKLLDELGNYEFNWSVGESQRMALEDWTTSKQVMKNINAYSQKKNFSGDIYGRRTTEALSIRSRLSL